MFLGRVELQLTTVYFVESIDFTLDIKIQQKKINFEVWVN